MSELQLHLQVEGSPEKAVDVAPDEFLIGRSPECDLHLSFPEISRYHSRLVKTPSQDWLLEDLGSTNGTLLNRVRVASAQKLRHGDVVQMGRVSLCVDFAASQYRHINGSRFPRLPCSPESAEIFPATEVGTIRRSSQDLQQQWGNGNQPNNSLNTEHLVNARLQYLVEIAKGLNSAESIEAIFEQVQEAVFREIKSIERLALLIDFSGFSQLELLNAAERNVSPEQTSVKDGSWISRTICQKVFTEKVAIKTINAQRDERFCEEESILAKQVCGVLAVPLWNEKQVVGVLYADAYSDLSFLDPAEDQDLSFFSALANLVASSVQSWLLTKKLQKEGNIRQRLERYHSPAVVQQLASVGELESENCLLNPTEAELSILFADLVGFTELSERLSATQISQLLNRFFEEMLQSLLTTGGTLDKFIGDSIMAFFGAPEPQPDHAERSVEAAKEMLLRLAQLNAAQTWSEPLQLRIAINSGTAVVGDVGSSQRADYTALGTTVNLASRLEAICYPGECVISEATYCRLKSPKEFSWMGECNLRGIKRPVRVYRANWL